MPAFNTVFFDLGSTLIYFDREWEPTMQEAAGVLHRKLLELGFALDAGFPAAYRAASKETYRERDVDLKETPAPVLLRRALARYGYSDLADAQVQAALAALYSVSQSHWHGEDDAIPTLGALRERGYRLGIISNAGYDEDIQILIDKANLRPYFEFIVSSAACGFRKPHPRIFELALESLSVPPEQAVMVGDFLSADILGANRMGMGSVWITRRADPIVSQALLATIQPQRTIAALAELPSLLETWDRAL